MPLPEDSNLKLSLRFSNNILRCLNLNHRTLINVLRNDQYLLPYFFANVCSSNRKGKKVGAGVSKKPRTNNSNVSNNSKGVHNNTNKKFVSTSISTNNNTTFRKDTKNKVFKPTLPPSLLSMTNTSDFTDTEGMCNNEYPAHRAVFMGNNTLAFN